MNKLDEDQLYKILVLIKNTIDEKKEGELIPRFPKNKALYSGNNRSGVLGDREESEAETVRRILGSCGLVGGYGIFRVVGESTNSSSDLSSFVCFCVPNKIDAMVEISLEKDHFVYTLTVKDIDKTKANVTRIHNRAVLITALENIKDKYR